MLIEHHSMVFLPFDASRLERRASRLLACCVLFFAGVLAVWLAVWMQDDRAADRHADGSSPIATWESAGAPRNEIDTPARTSKTVFSFLVSSANDMGITWVSVQFPDTATASPGAAPRLDAWQAQIQLRGSYPAVKRWLREAVGRYPNLVLQTARWAGSGPGSAPAAAETDVLDVQLQLVWLHRPASRPAGPAAAASVEGLLR